MLQLGKVQILGNELERLKVDVRGLSEVRWEGQGHFKTLQVVRLLSLAEETKVNTALQYGCTNELPVP